MEEHSTAHTAHEVDDTTQGTKLHLMEMDGFMVMDAITEHGTWII